jgi:hypothetical protein
MAPTAAIAPAPASPGPGALCIWRVPPCAPAIRRAITRPSPVPSRLVEKNGLWMPASCSAVIPGPSSATVTHADRPARSSETCAVPRARTACAAFTSRLTNSCSSAAALPSTMTGSRRGASSDSATPRCANSPDALRDAASRTSCSATLRCSAIPPVDGTHRSDAPSTSGQNPCRLAGLANVKQINALQKTVLRAVQCSRRALHRTVTSGPRGTSTNGGTVNPGTSRTGFGDGVRLVAALD